MNAEWQAFFENLFESKLQGVNQSMKDIELKLDQNMDTLKNGLITIAEDVKNIKLEQNKQGILIEQLQKEERNTNLIFHGLNRQSYHESLEKVIEILDSIGINSSKYLIKNIKKLGPGNWNDRPILVSFVSIPLKIDVLRNRKLISEKFQGITFKDDLSKEIREKRAKLSEYSQLAISNNIKAYMKKDKLVVHGKEWSLEELQNDSSNSFLKNTKRPREETSPPQGQITKKTQSYSSQFKTNSTGNAASPNISQTPNEAKTNNSLTLSNLQTTSENGKNL